MKRGPPAILLCFAAATLAETPNDCRYEIKHLLDYEDKWGLIADKLRPINIRQDQGDGIEA